MAAPGAVRRPLLPAFPPADLPGRLAALRTAPNAELKQQWRQLFGKEQPPFNRTRLQSPDGLPPR